MVNAPALRTWISEAQKVTEPPNDGAEAIEKHEQMLQLRDRLSSMFSSDELEQISLSVCELADRVSKVISADTDGEIVEVFEQLDPIDQDACTQVSKLLLTNMEIEDAIGEDLKGKLFEPMQIMLYVHCELRKKFKSVL